jgi:hypothetical protein
VKSLYQEYAGAGAPFVEGAPPTGEALPQFVEERFGLAAALVEESLGGQ